MKKYIFFFLSLFLILLPSQMVRATVFEVDQSYKPSPAFGSYNISGNTPIGQIFKPEKGTLSGAEVVINTTSVGNFDFILYLNQSGTNLSSSTISENLVGSNQTLIFSFDDFPNLAIGSAYTLYLETTDANARWNYGQSGAVGGYSDGHAILAGVVNAADFHFVTYGPVTGLQDDEIIDSEEEEQETSEKLSAPTNLDTIDLGSDYIKVSWDEVDDANLDGYKIYWGTNRKNLKEKADAGSENTYKVKGLRASTKYYFAVTAYDENRKESSRSKILEAETKSNKQKIDSSDILWYIARVVSVLILIGAVVFWYFWKKRHPKKAESQNTEKEIAVNIKHKYPHSKFKFED